MKTEAYHAFMLDHATGGLAPALQVAGDIHCALDASGRDSAALWDCLGGVLLEDPVVMEAPVTARRTKARPGRPAVSAGDILSTDLSGITWRRGLSGVRYANTPIPHGQFMRLDPGQLTPAHGHSALEATVVLEGELDVDGMVYTPGQLVIGSPGERHQPMAGNCSLCICYVGRESRPFWRFS